MGKNKKKTITKKKLILFVCIYYYWEIDDNNNLEEYMNKVPTVFPNIYYFLENKISKIMKSVFKEYFLYVLTSHSNHNTDHSLFNFMLGFIEVSCLYITQNCFLLVDTGNIVKEINP